MDKEKELMALKNRRARLWDYFANPRALICDGTSKQRFEELCEVNNRIAHLEGQAVPDSAREEEIRRILFVGEDESERTAHASDNVNHPSHYTSGGIECIDAMKAMLTGYEQRQITTRYYWHFLAGQVLKYLWRWPLKERPLQDLKKARWYLDRLIDDVESQDKNYAEKEISE